MKCQHQCLKWLYHFWCIHSKAQDINISFLGSSWWSLRATHITVQLFCILPSSWCQVIHLCIYLQYPEGIFSCMSVLDILSNSMLSLCFSNLPLLWLDKAVERPWLLIPLAWASLSSSTFPKIKLLTCHLVIHQGSILFLLCYKSLK